jgi:phage tail-like protein
MAQTIPGQLHIQAPDQEPYTVELDKPIVRLGRLQSPENDVPLVHGSVSRRHAQIFCDRQPYRIIDLGSSNGTQVNDIPLPAQEVRELRDGDRIVIGPFTMAYRAPRVPEVGEPTADQQAPPEDAFGGLRVQEAPLVPPPPPPPPAERAPETPPVEPWAGMPRDRSRWLQYLPYIYSEDAFMGRFLLLFEDLFGPLDQSIAHLSMYLDPRTAPESFLPVLAGWLGLVLDERWPAERKRAILQAAVELYDLRGTARGLAKLLEASSGGRAEIVENVDGPHSFRVTLTPAPGKPIDEQMARYLIDTNKPAHTVYRLEIVT